MKLLRNSLLILLASTWLATATYAFPVDQCASGRFGSDLVCTAGDVSITGMKVVGDTTSCVGGTNITLDLQLTVNFAVPDRWDIGIFISNDGNDPQLLPASGGANSCSVTVLPNSNPFLDLDGADKWGASTGDTCGDGNKNIGGGTGSGIHFMPNVTVPCQSLAGAGGALYIPFVVSWDNQASPTGNTCTSNLDPVPNTKSKCNSPTIAQGSVSVVVLPTITMSDGIETIFSGGTTNYQVVITNTTGADLPNVVFTDPAVSGITANSVSCAPAGGASCPASSTVADMQGGGITLPTIPNGGSLTFTIGATLTGTAGQSITNTATVAVSGQSNSASDTDIIVDTIAILPNSQAKSSSTGATVSYTYTLYNFDGSDDTITLSAVSSMGWTTSISPTPVSVAAGGSQTITVTVNVPAGASIGDIDTTLITATSSNNPAKSATATAVTTVTEILTLIPSNTGSGGAGASVYYLHRVQNHAATSKSVSLTPSFSSGSCTGWSNALYESDYYTALSSPITLAANGGYKDFLIKVTIPSGAASNDVCTTQITAAYDPSGSNPVTVNDITTVKNLVLYEDPGYTIPNDTYPAGNLVYAKGFGLDDTLTYEYRWYDASNSEVCNVPVRLPSTVGTTFPDTCEIPISGPLGTWTVQIWDTTNDVLFVQNQFYVGPDHLQASYSGANPPINTNTVIDIALHDRYNHVAPLDGSGDLVLGDPTDPEGPLMVEITVSGSAQIVGSNLSNYTISGQTIIGKLSTTDGTATITINDTLAEMVTITPKSYKGKLYGSTKRDEPVSVTFVSPPIDHYAISFSGDGITCEAKQITVTAHDTSHNPVNVSSNTTITVTTNPTVDAITTSPLTIAAGSSSATFYLTETTVTTSPHIDIHVVDGSGTSEDSGSAIAADDPVLAFVNTAFRFVDSSSGTALNIGNQIGGKPSSTAPGVQTIGLQPIRTDDNTGACVAVFVSQTTSVNLAYECNNPTACTSTNLLTLSPESTYNPANITTLSRNNSGSVASYTGVNLDFDANGIAPLSFIYADVGQITLHANKTLTADGTTTPPTTAVTLNGSSNPFVVKPQVLVTTPSGTTPYKAGVGGPVTVKAVLWDSDNTNLADNPVATQFGQETSPTLTFSYATTETAAGNVTLTKGATSSAVPLTSSGTVTSFTLLNTDFTGGVASLDLNWDEVGLVTLSSSSDYLGSGVLSTTTDVPFVPYDLRITVATDGLFSNTHTTGTTDFTYMGESFGFDVNPTFTVEAVAYCAAPPCPVTTNYSGTWASKISASTMPTADLTGTDTGQAWTIGGITYTPGDFTLGVATVTLGATTNYTKPNAPVAPFTSNIDPTFAISLTTSDGLTSAQSLTFNPTGNLERYGRIVMADTYGPVDLPLEMVYSTEYFNGTSFIPNTDDLDTSLTAAVDLSCISPFSCSVDGTAADLQVTGVAITPGNSFTLTPTITLNGSATIQPTAPAWLTFDWDGDPLTAPTFDNGTASFGLYRSDDRFHYWHEER